MGIGSSVDIIRKLTRLRSRWEAVPEDRDRIDEMRRKVRELLDTDAKPMSGHGGDRVQVDISTPNEQSVDTSNKTQGGTSREYILRRLKRDRPDLADEEWQAR